MNFETFRVLDTTLLSELSRSSEFAPSLAGQSVYMALRLRAATATTLQLEIADGSGAARATSNATLTAAGGWQTHRTFATLAWGGEARFGVRLGGSVEVATVAVAPIGTAWQM